MITSLANFWMTAFRLPSGCIKEIERLCSAFLWSGPNLNARKAKVSWADICSTKEEGGLGLRSLKEANTVSCLKLIWRILSANSMWVNWVKVYLILKSSFWMIKDTTQTGSWMWKKILKCRELAKKMYRVEVRNGKKTSFWFEQWSPLGCLKDLLNDGSRIDMGILLNATVEESWKHRKRNHRVLILNKVEEEIEKSRGNRVAEEDVSLWQNEKGLSRRNFSSKETWEFIREKKLTHDWAEIVWFKYYTPKYSFIMWLAMRGRLATGDRMRCWQNGAKVDCVLCNEPLETTEHLFFECIYSARIWEALVKGILKDRFTVKWEEIKRLLRGSGRDKMQSFLVKYILQAAVYML